MNHIDRFGDGLKLSPNFWETKLDGIQGYNDGDLPTINLAGNDFTSTVWDMGIAGSPKNTEMRR
jgi:hypothetical protein